MFSTIRAVLSNRQWGSTIDNSKATARPLRMLVARKRIESKVHDVSVLNDAPLVEMSVDDGCDFVRIKSTKDGFFISAESLLRCL